MTNNEAYQKTITIAPKARGFHLITEEINKGLSTMASINTGLANLFIQHTSASLTISENACADVRYDLEAYFKRTIPDDTNMYTHTLEGPDDMPAHIKNTILGASLNIPVANNNLLLGTWQGVYLCEHRERASSRKLVITIINCK